MKKIPLVLLFCAALQFNTYAQKTPSEIDDESKAILSQIRAIRLVEVNQARTLVVKSLSYNPGKRGLARLNYPLEQLAVYKKGSEIVITDTVGLFNGNIHVEIVPSEEGVDIIIALDVLPNSYYCQMTVGDRMTTERGLIGTHRTVSNLNTMGNYTGSDHFASAAAYREIVIFRQQANGGPIQVGRFSTDNQTEYVYRENGSLVVAQ